MKSLLLLVGLVGLGYVGLHGVKGDFWDKPLFAKATPEPAPAPAVVFVQPAPAPAPAPVEVAPYVNPLHRSAYDQKVAVPNPGAINYNRTVVIVQQPQAPVWKQPEPVFVQKPVGTMTKDVMEQRNKDLPLVQGAR